NAVAAIARDDVVSDSGVARAAGDQDAVAGVGHRGLPYSIGADVVAPDHVGVGADVGRLDAVAAVAGDDVALGGVVDAVGVRADAVAARAAAQEDAVLAVGQGGGPGGVGADVVAGDDVLRGADVADLDAERAVGRDDVAFQVIADAVAVAADAVAPGPGDEPDAHAEPAADEVAVAQGGAGDVGADAVAGDDVVTGAAADLQAA